MHHSPNDRGSEHLCRPRLAYACVTVLAAGVPLGLVALVGWLLGG